MRRSILYFASWRLVIASSVFGFLEDRALLCPGFPPEPTGLGRSGAQDRGSRNAAQAGPRGAGYLGAKHGKSTDVDTTLSLDYLVGACDERRRDFEAQRFRRLEV